MIVARDFLEWIEHYTSSTQTTLMVLRTVGPDNATDADKVNHIYSIYKSNFDSEEIEIFNKFLYNEFTFIEFDTEEEAYQFGIENFPMTRSAVDDQDYFVQMFIFNGGNLAYANDSLEGLSDRVPPAVILPKLEEPVE